jgi:hypothetical protein
MKERGSIYGPGEFTYPGKLFSALFSSGIIGRFDMCGGFRDIGFISPTFENYSTEFAGNLTNRANESSHMNTPLFKLIYGLRHLNEGDASTIYLQNYSFLPFWEVFLSFFVQMAKKGVYRG